MKISTQHHDEIRALVRAGKTAHEVARHLGCSVLWFRTYLQRHLPELTKRVQQNGARRRRLCGRPHVANVAAVREMARNGADPYAIAVHLCCSVQTVRNYLRGAYRRNGRLERYDGRSR